MNVLLSALLLFTQPVVGPPPSVVGQDNTSTFDPNGGGTGTWTVTVP